MRAFYLTLLYHRVIFSLPFWDVQTKTSERLLTTDLSTSASIGNQHTSNKPTYLYA